MGPMALNVSPEWLSSVAIIDMTDNVATTRSPFGFSVYLGGIITPGDALTK